jgi:hypothetical protein
MTSYVCLKKLPGVKDEAPRWIQGVTIDAVSAEAAVRKTVDGEQGGTYVAVPLRSFQEMTVTVETKRTLKLVGNDAG